MKRLFVPFLLVIALLFACRNGENKNATSNEATVSTEQIESESAELEKTTDEIESKSAALEEALKDLD